MHVDSCYRIKNENYISFGIGIVVTIKKVFKLMFCTGAAEVVSKGKNFWLENLLNLRFCFV